MEVIVETSELSDEQLAALAAREGSDGPAFVALVDRFQDRVWRVCYRLMGNADDASDAAQEVFVRLFMQRSQFEGRSKYSTWMHGIAIRTCLMLRRGLGRRRKHERKAQELEAERQTRGTPANRPENSLDLAQMLDTLDEADRALLILKYAEGRSYEELSAMFDLSVSACKMRIKRARERLQKEFPEHSFSSDEE